MAGKGRAKQRGQICFNRKLKRRTDQWRRSPKIQEKHTLEQWTSKIKRPTTKG